jgi:hypothetical protein
MRTSTKLFLSATVLFAVGLAIYDLQLIEVFRKGDYKRDFYDYEAKPFKGFDRIRLNPSTALNIHLVKGDFKVLAAPGIRDFVDIRQQGDELIVDARFKDHYRGIFADFTLYVSCPTIKEFRTDAVYEVGDLPHTDLNWEVWHKTTVIEGFSLDSLQLTEDHASHVLLKKDSIRKLSAVVGPGAVLTVGANNAIGGDVEVRNQGRLLIKTAEVSGLHYHLADSAAVELSGSAAKQLIKSIQP